MTWNFVKFERFDVGERPSFGKARYGFQSCARTGVDDHIGSAQPTGRAVRQRDLQGLRRDEAAGAKNEFGFSLFVVLQIDVDPTGYHLAFALADYRHTHGEVPFGYAELFAPPQIPGNFRAVNDVLAGHAGNVLACPADVLSFDHRDTLSLSGKSP